MTNSPTMPCTCAYGACGLHMYKELEKFQVETGATRVYATGATRDSDNGKLKYEGFISPIVLRCYAEYMHEARLRNIPEGDKIRSPDNWQKGIHLNDYADSLVRHVFEFWMMHRGFEVRDEKGNVMEVLKVLCAILFNTMGYMFELLKDKSAKYQSR